MRAGILLSVRAKATRLPGKVLKSFGNYPSVTEHLLHRLAASKKSEKVILATSNDPRDDILIEIAKQNGFEFYRGSAEDKLLRYRDAADAFSLDFSVVVDGDDPFVSISHIDQIIDHAAASGGDYIIVDKLPVGATGFGLSTKGLHEVCSDRAEADTEIWASHYLKNPKLECVCLEETDATLARPDIRMTLDYPEDYDFFLAVLERLSADGLAPHFKNIMALLSERHEIPAINAAVQEKYEAHLRRSAS